MGPLGKQIAIELCACDSQRLDDVEFIRQAMIGAANEAGAQIVTEAFHRFAPHGISGVIIITESHLAIHTWPEYGYAAVDLFTCGDELATDRAIHHLQRSLGSKRVSFIELLRGPVSTKKTNGSVEYQGESSVFAEQAHNVLPKYSVGLEPET